MLLSPPVAIIVEMGTNAHHIGTVDEQTGVTTFEAFDGGENRVAQFGPIPEPDGQRPSIAEVFANITRPAQGWWDNVSAAPPTWVSVPEWAMLEELIADHYGCPRGKPVDVEETHWTEAGPPGADGAAEAVEEPA